MSSCCLISTPVGTIRLVAGDLGLTDLIWCRGTETDPEPTVDPRLLLAAKELGQYFSGDLRSFTVPIDYSRWQGFTAQVYKALASVPFGETISYGELASRAGRPAAARAVGRIMANNPLPLILPCHRVIAASGAMTGYSGGEGIATKIFLLQHEKTV